MNVTVIQGKSPVPSIQNMPSAESIVLTVTPALADEIHAADRTKVVCTFNAFIYGVLLQQEIYITLLPDPGRWDIVNKLAAEGEIAPEMLAEQISLSSLGLYKEKSDLITRYREYLKAQGLMDTDEMTVFFAQHLEKDSVLREKLNLLYPSMYVAELDKLNTFQYRIITLIASEASKLYFHYVPGDSRPALLPKIVKEFPGLSMLEEKNRPSPAKPKSQAEADNKPASKGKKSQMSLF